MDKNGIHIKTPIENVYHMADGYGVHSTLVVGSRQALLVDTGIGIADLAGAVREITQLPLIVVNTHGHADHMGGNYRFDEVLLCRDDWETAQLALSEETKRSVLARLPAEAVPECFDKERFLGNSTENLRPLSLDSRFDLGGECVSVVPLRNHTPGSMGFLCERKRLLLTGDAVAPFVYLYFPESCSLAGHIAMLRSLQEDTRFDRMLCAHSEQVMQKSEIGLMIRCAQNAVNGRHPKYSDPMFPQYVGCKHLEMEDDSCALIAFNPEKL